MQEKSESASTRQSLATYLWVAAISAGLGFAAVYATLGRPDTAAVPGPAGPVASPALATPAPGAAGGTTEPAADAMAGFVRKAAREAMPEVSFVGGDGKSLKLSDFKGRVVLLNLWATWCAPCRMEMPSLDRLQKALGSDKFEVVALAIDRGGLEAAGKFLAETKVESLKLYVDPSAKLGSQLKALGLPTTILIDKDGREVGRLAGPAEWDGAEAKGLIEAAMR